MLMHVSRLHNSKFTEHILLLKTHDTSRSSYSPLESANLIAITCTVKSFFFFSSQ